MIILYFYVLTSFVFGVAFAGCWTPYCGIFTLAATCPGTAYNFLVAFSLGLGVPFLITRAFFSRATGLIRRIVKYPKILQPSYGRNADCGWYFSVYHSIGYIG
jgi:cytochrome c biogenesis protein CcdA